MEKLKIACIQTHLVWEDPVQNRMNFEAKIKVLPKVDLIVLPEMFSSGFTMNPSAVAEDMSGETIKWMLLQSKKTKAAILGSLVIEEDHQFYNRLIFIEPSGQISHYDKRHTFTLAGEDKVYSRGHKKLIITYKDWKICPLICYDLRFPVWARNTNEYDLLIYVANWPKPRILAWDTLLKARAIENMTYCIGVNRIGSDINGYEYIGHSSVYGPLGEALAHSKTEDTVTITSLDKNGLIACRNKFNFLEDQDQFKLL